MEFINSQLDRIKELCALNKVNRLFAFGSVVCDKLAPHSDVDLVVEIEAKDPFGYTDSYFALKESLQYLFNRPVDLLEDTAIKNPFLREEIEKTKVLLYEK